MTILAIDPGTTESGYGATEQQSIDDLNICLGYLRSEIKTM